jgi:hypothetical protein
MFNSKTSQAQCFMLIIPGTWKAEVGGSLTDTDKSETLSGK